MHSCFLHNNDGHQGSRRTGYNENPIVPGRGCLLKCSTITKIGFFATLKENVPVPA